jgi:hypothetical protein
MVMTANKDENGQKRTKETKKAKERNKTHQAKMSSPPPQTHPKTPSGKEQGLVLRKIRSRKKRGNKQKHTRSINPNIPLNRIIPLLVPINVIRG